MLAADAAAAWQAEHSRERTISLFDRQGASAAAYTRIFCLLALVQELLLSKQQASQRDVYYRSVNTLRALSLTRSSTCLLGLCTVRLKGDVYSAGSSTFASSARQSM